MRPALEAGRKLETQRHLRRAAEATKLGDTRSALRSLMMAQHVEQGGKRGLERADAVAAFRRFVDVVTQRWGRRVALSLGPTEARRCP